MIFFLIPTTEVSYQLIGVNSNIFYVVTPGGGTVGGGNFISWMQILEEMNDRILGCLLWTTFIKHGVVILKRWPGYFT